MIEFRLKRLILPQMTYDTTSVNVTTHSHTRAARGQRGTQAIASENDLKKYNMNFKNMIANVNNVKPGCRKCRGTH